MIPGQVPALSGEFPGCRFADRCERVFDRCRTEPPGWTRVADGHLVRCHLRETERAGAIAARAGARASSRRRAAARAGRSSRCAT